MSKKLPAVTLTILNKEYKIACPSEEQPSLLSTAKQLNDKMHHLHDSGKLTGTDRIAVMAALNLAHEWEMAKPQAPDKDSVLIEKLISMRQKIENALKNS